MANNEVSDSMWGFRGWGIDRSPLCSARDIARGTMNVHTRVGDETRGRGW